MKLDKTRLIAVNGLFVAIIILLANTHLGFIQFGFVHGTTLHIPVIIGSILLGPISGAFLGFTFGVVSMITNIVQPSVLSFAFTPFYNGGNLYSLIVCFVPRILIGVVPYFTVKLLSLIKFKKTAINSFVNYCIAAFLGSMTNTLLVMNFIYIFFARTHSSSIVQGFGLSIAGGSLYGAILSVILVLGVPEACGAVLISAPVCRALEATKNLFIRRKQHKVS